MGLGLSKNVRHEPPNAATLPRVPSSCCAPVSIRSRLLLIVLSVWLPAAAAFGLLARSTYLRGEDAARQQVQQLAERLNAEVEREIERREVMARTLSASQALAEGRYAVFHAEASAAVRQTDSWALVNTPDRQLLNTRVPFAAQGVPRLNPGRQLLSHESDVRFVLRGPLSNEPVVGVFVPDGQQPPRHNVGVAFTARVLQTLVERLPYPEGSVVAVMDQRQMVAARSRDPAKWLGARPTGELARRAAAGEHGFAQTVTLDGVASLSYLSPPNRHGWAVVIALPMSTLAQAANRLTLQALGASAVLLLVGLALALLAARRISTPMFQLRDAALQLGADQVPPELATGVSEADAVGAALRRAGLHAQQAQQQLQARVTAAVEEARQAQAQLLESQKHEAIGRLTGGLAHDFNNLLQTITTAVQLALRVVPEGPHRRALQAAVGASAKAAGLVRQMLAFGRAATLAPRPVAVNDWLLQSEELIKKTLQGRIALSARIAPGLPAMMVDPTQLDLALLNLIFNARDAMPEGGTVTIAGREAEAEDLSGLPPGRYLRLSVADTGQGMDAATLAKAVEPYFTTKPVGAGSGLGLAQVQAFARHSGGALRLRSQPGQGTEVTMLLPVAAQPADAVPAALPGPEGASGAAAAPEAVPTRPLRVLMVEDDALAASVVVPALQAAGHQVQLCDNADQAQALLQGEAPFDVLFTDVVMPGRLNGLDLAHWVREHRPQLPTVLATGFTQQAPDAGLVVLRKPYAIDHLLATLATAAAR